MPREKKIALKAWLWEFIMLIVWKTEKEHFQLTSEWFSFEYCETKTKPVTYQLDYSANLKP